MSGPIIYVRHLTLDTGHQRDSYRSEVDDEVLAVLRPLLERAIAGGTVTIPGDIQPAGCMLAADRGPARTLVATVWGPSETLRGPSWNASAILQVAPVPIVTLGVAETSLASATLWRAWFRCQRDDRTPSPPWCVVRIHPGLAVYPEAADWTGDFARCLAWAWIDGGPLPPRRDPKPWGWIDRSGDL